MRTAPVSSSVRSALPGGLAALSVSNRRTLLKLNERSYHLTARGYRCGPHFVSRVRANFLLNNGYIVVSYTPDDIFVVRLTYEGALCVQALRKGARLSGGQVGLNHAPNYGQLEFPF